MKTDSLPLADSVKLPPCPFCAEVPSRIFGVKDLYAHSWDAACWLSGAQFTAEQWSTRASTPPPQGEETSLADRLRKAARECSGWEPSISVLERVALEAADELERLTASPQPPSLGQGERINMGVWLVERGRHYEQAAPPPPGEAEAVAREGVGYIAALRSEPLTATTVVKSRFAKDDVFGLARCFERLVALSPKADGGHHG